MTAVFHAEAGRAARRASSVLPRWRRVSQRDAAAGELVEDLVGGQLGVEDQQAGIAAGGLLPVVGEGDDLGGLLGLGDVGVGVHHVGGGVVLGEEGEHGAGALGAAGDVVLFQHGLVAVVADGVEVAVEPGLAGGQPERPQRLDQPGQQLLVGVAADPPGVGAQVGGLGQGGQPEGERQPGVVGQRAGVGDAGLAGALGQQQRADRLPRRQFPGGGVAGLADQVRQADLGDGGQQQQQPGVIARQRQRLGRPAGQGGGLDRVEPGRRAAAALVAAGQPRQPLGVEDLPDGLRRDRHPLGGERGGDLGDRMPGRAQLQHPGPQLAGGLARAFGAGPGLGEQVQPALAQQRGHLVDAGGGVAEPVGDLGGGHLLGEVGAQRLIPALRRAGRLP